MADGMTPNPQRECPDDRNEQEKLEELADTLLTALPFEEGIRLYNERPQFYEAFDVLLDHPEYEKAQVEAVLESVPSPDDREQLRRLQNVMSLIRAYYTVNKCKEWDDDDDPATTA